MRSPIPPTARNKAMHYLAMREHSYLELARKLTQKGYESAEIESALTGLIDDDLLSDMRFGEAFVRSRVLKGQGAVRIRMELKEKGLNDAQIENAFRSNSSIDWDSLIEQVFLKKFPVADVACEGADEGALLESRQTSAAEKAKQWRFLQYRGFTSSQINDLFRRINTLS